MQCTEMMKKLRWGLAIVAAFLTVGAGSAVAAPSLQVRTLIPDYVTPGANMLMLVSVLNTGTDPLSGNLEFRYTFPSGVPPVDPANDSGSNGANLQCQTAGQVVDCTLDVTGVPSGAQVRFRTMAVVDPGASGVLAGGEVEVSGGGTSDVVVEPFTLTAGPIGAFQVRSFDVGMSDAPAAPPMQAGTDPMELRTTASLLSSAQVNFDNATWSVTSPTESFRDVVVHVPPGFVGNPTATPLRCTAAQLATFFTQTTTPTCPLESQIGLVQLNGSDIVPLFNVVPPVGSPAEFGFSYQTIGITLLAKVRPSDNGIDIITRKSPSSVPIPKFDVTLWGVPGDPSHNPLRGGVCLNSGLGNDGRDCSIDTPRVPFLRTPTSCPGTPLLWSIDMTTYQHPDTLFHNATQTPAIEGCQYNPFDPSLSLVPSTLAPHAASGVDATVSLRQDYGPDGIAPADLRRISVTLPQGLTINPSSADGLQACTDAELNLRQDGVATCPDASKLGTVTLHTPLLDHPVTGNVFLRTQASDDPLTGNMFRMAIEIRSDDDGIDIKLPGSIIPNPNRGTLDSGQVTTVFDDLPQLPFDSMTLHFKTGPRAPLATPSTCGVKTTNVELTSWGDKVVDTSSSFVTSGCNAPRFAPTFRAGVENPVAGGSSPMHVSFGRTDDDEEFSTVTINTPKGLLARVKDAQQCSNDAANAGTCPDGSLIGHATVAAGVGSNPFYVTNGRVYLTTPYRRAPYGLAVVVDAIAGPFDLGKVVVRQAIHVDPRTAALSVVSDPFPTNVKGVVLHVRQVRVAIDKPHFMVSPTNCSKQEIGGTATSVDGATAALASRFQVGSCKSLRFTPKLSLSVGGTGHTRRGNSTPFRAVLTQKPGQSNLKSVKVSLPQTLAALLPVVNRACTLAQYQSGRCRQAEAGSAVAKTPLLKDPLKGGAFFVRHPGRPLPDLMVALRGDIDIDLVGRVTIPGGTRLATNFDTIPDAPVSKFTLNIVAGSHGPLGVSANLCSRRGKRSTADVTMRGQNGDVLTSHPRLHISGCGGGGKHR
jgi:hypothetical protein